MFAEDGEAAFRATEEEMTLELLNRRHPGVLALGGGAIGHEQVRAALEHHAVIWLDVDLDLAWRRCRDSGRPLARERERFEHLYRRREPIYADLADAIVPAGARTGWVPVLAALEAMPERTKLLWATSASAEYPAYIGDGLVTEHGFWPAAVAGAGCWSPTTTPAACTRICSTRSPDASR